MQKFDWNTFNATHDHADGPVSRYVHDADDFAETASEFSGNASATETIANLFCGVVVLLGLAALKLAVF
ncbi:MAG: hypothetical protein JHC57_07900 [Sphingopyxis sp.]|uniref:hypothetical protein n=1 Tax=Sphingopyxis sp. TaxID=1908224 RepID=UPI001A27016A|nr:hypothetical protein [Sphingopyxis sp.]MBJ7499659.1 hypothetical protein [Sphingopyxis sp.]